MTLWETVSGLQFSLSGNLGTPSLNDAGPVGVLYLSHFLGSGALPSTDLEGLWSRRPKQRKAWGVSIATRRKCDGPISDTAFDNRCINEG